MLKLRIAAKEFTKMPAQVVIPSTGVLSTPLGRPRFERGGGGSGEFNQGNQIRFSGRSRTTHV